MVDFILFQYYFNFLKNFTAKNGLLHLPIKQGTAPSGASLILQTIQVSESTVFGSAGTVDADYSLDDVAFVEVTFRRTNRTGHDHRAQHCAAKAGNGCTDENDCQVGEGYHRQ